MDSKNEVPPQLAGYPEKIQEDFSKFQETNSPDDLGVFVLETLGFLSDGEEGIGVLLSVPDETQILEQSGIDSLALAELVFLIEDLFNYSISDEQMRSMETVGNLKSLMVELLSEAKPSSSQ